MTTLTDQLASNPSFVQCVAEGRKLGDLCLRFPSFGETTVKNARSKVRYAAKAAAAPTMPEPDAPEVEKTETRDTLSVSIKSPVPIKTLAALLAAAEVDEQVWEVDRWTCNTWPTHAFDKAKGEFARADNWQVKATFKRKHEVASVLAEIADLKARALEHMPTFLPIVRKPGLAGLMLEVSIPDLHVGKLAWAKEVGESYDVHIAERLFRDALTTLLYRASTHEFQRILFVVGNDLLHVDGPKNMTFNGTPQDADSRYQRTFVHARNLMIEAVETLLQIADVDVMVVPGNHDQTAAFHLGDSLECWFHACSQVTVDNRPMLRKYIEWGKVMLMFTHGDKEKSPRLGQIAASEEPEMWGRTLHREAHIGHLHHQELKDEPGFTVRRLSSLSGLDAYHHQFGFVGVPRRAETFVWDREEGLIGTQVYSSPRVLN